MNSVQAAPVSAPSDPAKSFSSPRVIASLGLLLSIAFSLAFLSVRNIYDDEYSSLSYVRSPIPAVIHRANSEDVHPPGMYVLDRLSYKVFPSARWLTLGELLFLYTGLAVYLLQLTPLFSTARTRLCFVLLASLHPQLLMWGNTNRWYGWWTGMALISLMVALRPTSGRAAHLSLARALAIALLCTALFYINYLTIVFTAALIGALLYRFGIAALKQCAAIVITTLLLTTPQLRAFLKVHIPGGQGQRSGIMVATLRLAFSLICSEALLPWHPLAIAMALSLFALGIYALILIRRHWSRWNFKQPGDPLTSILIFSAFFALGLMASGLGGKPRNGLLLAPLFAAAVALVLGMIRRTALQTTLLVVFFAWTVTGMEHLLRREHLAKGSMISRPDEVVRYVASQSPRGCAVIFTYEAQLVLALRTSATADDIVMTPAQNAIYSPYSDPAKLALKTCDSVKIYWVQSYLGGYGPAGDVWHQELIDAEHATGAPIAQASFSLDPDAPMKRKLTFLGGSADLPSDRYTVSVTDTSNVSMEQLEQLAPHFTLADGVSRALKKK